MVQSFWRAIWQQTELQNCSYTLTKINYKEQKEKMDCEENADQKTQVWSSLKINKWTSEMLVYVHLDKWK